MKKTKKIKLEDLKIQSFSTSQQLSKDQTNKIVGGEYTHEASCLQTCESECCWQTNGCYTNPGPYGPCTGGGPGPVTNHTGCGSCPENNCTYTVGAGCGGGTQLDCSNGCTGPYC